VSANTELRSGLTGYGFRITMSTLRLRERPSAFSLVLTGWYSANPAAESRSGSKPYPREPQFAELYDILTAAALLVGDVVLAADAAGRRPTSKNQPKPTS